MFGQFLGAKSTIVPGSDDMCTFQGGADAAYTQAEVRNRFEGTEGS